MKELYQSLKKILQNPEESPRNGIQILDIFYCKVDTVPSGEKFYGTSWAKICRTQPWNIFIHELILCPHPHHHHHHQSNPNPRIRLSVCACVTKRLHRITHYPQDNTLSRTQPWNIFIHELKSYCALILIIIIITNLILILEYGCLSVHVSRKDSLSTG